MVPQERFELPTPGLGNLCSIHLSYWGGELMRLLAFELDNGEHLTVTEAIASMQVD